jgi:mono/diheme cytochrome c family protein
MLSGRKIAAVLAVAVLAGAMLAATAGLPDSTGVAQEPARRAKKSARSVDAHGLELLQHYCARCHAVGASDASAHHLAPPFRTLGQRYAIDSLEEALAEGLVSGHPDMPEFTFAPDDVGAIIAYLKSIQTKP